MWRIRIDTSGNKIALEVRDADLLISSFWVLDAVDFNIAQLAVPSAQAWWKGLDDINDNLVYLHGYGDRKTGQHKGITVYNAVGSGKVWEAPELAFYGFETEGVLVYTADNPESSFKLISSENGRELKNMIPQQVAADKVELFSQKRYKNCIYPSLYLEGEEYFEQVKEFLLQSGVYSPIKAVAYAETDTAIVVSFYEQTAEAGLVNYIAVFDLSGTLMLKETLGSGLSGIGSDSFFIFNFNLYFLQDKNILKVYRLLA